MSRRMAVSEGAIRSHKCCLCGHLLSVAPIVSTGLETELYKCGRCSQVECQSYVRARLFEDVAQHLSFPCSFAPCDKKIPWGRVELHERNCRYRTMKCPIYYHNCSDVVLVEHLLDHFTEKHLQNLRCSRTPWNVEVTLDYVYLIQEGDELFLVYILHLGEAFSVAVLALQRSKFTKFDLELLPSNEDTFAVSFKGLPVVRYDERSHCYMCVRKKCKERHHPFSENNRKKEMDQGSFTSKLKSDLISSVKGSKGELSYKVSLVADEAAGRTMEPPAEEEDVLAADDNAGGRRNLELLRRVLTCPICMTYMAAPIFTCATGHTICNVCRPRNKVCPMCADAMGSARNYSLEELVDGVRVPCQYDSKGCTFLGKAAKMYIHEMECTFCSELKE